MKVWLIYGGGKTVLEKHVFICGMFWENSEEAELSKLYLTLLCKDWHEILLIPKSPSWDPA